MNDDFFFLADVDTLPLYRRQKPLGDYLAGLKGETDSPDPEHRAYVRGIRGQYDLLKRWGHKDPIQSTELHLPIPLDRTHLAAVLAAAAVDAPDLEAGHFRALYGAALDTVEAEDVKVPSHNGQMPKGGFVSTGPVSWSVGLIGKTIRRRYWRPSPWEKR